MLRPKQLWGPEAVKLSEYRGKKGQAIVSEGRVEFLVDVKGIRLTVIILEFSSVSLELLIFPAIYYFIMQHNIFFLFSTKSIWTRELVLFLPSKIIPQVLSGKQLKGLCNVHSKFGFFFSLKKVLLPCGGFLIE